jgi:serine/threonine-protein kinase HipA
MYHKKCSLEFFNVYPPPNLDIKSELLEEYAQILTGGKITIPGVQKKLSLGFSTPDENYKSSRLTVIGLGGGYILKLPTEEFPFLIELEYATMHLARLFEIQTVPFALLPMQNGDLAYITRRIDRVHSTGEKIPMEDFCQIMERLTEDKYKGSLESIGKRIKSTSIYSVLDVYNFFVVNLFSWIIGNSDMHLKNFSMYLTKEGHRLTPAYDLLATQILLPEDKEEVALTLNGKKAKLNKKDWFFFAENIGITEKTREKLWARIGKIMPTLVESISEYPLPIEVQDKWKKLILERWNLIL